MTNFECDFFRIQNESDMRRQISKESAQRIKNISTKFSISCLKLTGGYLSIIIINLVEKLLKKSTFLKESHVNEAGIGNEGAEKIAKALFERINFWRY